MTGHTHWANVDGCYRCDPSRDEARMLLADLDAMYGPRPPRPRSLGPKAKPAATVELAGDQ